jgi:hypothetical protein
MIMRIKLDCPCCTAKVFAAVGTFIGKNEEPSAIRSVEAFEFGVSVSWDVHPSDEQIEEFRRIWDEMTQLEEIVIAHAAPSFVVDKPHFASLN